MNNFKKTYQKNQKTIPDEILYIQSSFTQFINSINHKKLTQYKTQQLHPHLDFKQSQRKSPMRYSKILHSKSKYSQNKSFFKQVQLQDQPLKKSRTNKIKFHDNLKLNLSVHKDNSGINESQVKNIKNKISSIRQRDYEHEILRYQSNRQKMQNKRSFNLGLISKQKQSKMNIISQNLKFNDENASNSKMRTTKQSKFNISRVSNINFNPEINNLSLMNSRQLKIFSSQNLLLSLLKIDSQKAIDILLSSGQKMQGQITGKKIFTFFKRIFKQLNIPNIQNPLIKKFNNCVYYGQRIGLNSKHCGIISYNNGSLYLGQLSNFRKHGQGIQIVQCKHVRSSQFVLENTEFQSYVVYKGSFYKNTKSCNFMVEAENFMYQGELVKGYLHGKGKLITKDSIFQGLWDMNQKVKGIQQFKRSSCVYEGQYKSGNFHGKGKLKTSNQLFEGEFEQGKKHGKGIIVTKQYIYQGYFKNDKKFGQGIMLDKNINLKLLSQLSNQDQKIFNVKFQDDYLIFKSEFIKNKFNQINLQSLQTFNQNSSNLTDIASLIDKQFLLPTKSLNKAHKDNLQITQMMIQNPEYDIKESKLVYFNVIPKQPQQQHINIFNKKVSYLQGNSRNSFLIKNHPIRN